MRATLIAAVLILLVPPTAQAVTAGPLVSHVERDPWHLTFTGAHNRPVLTEKKGAGLGYSAGGAWFYATRVIAEQKNSASTYEADLATTNPLGTIHVKIDRDSDGVIAVSVSAAAGASASGASFDALPHEHYVGFGERSNAVDQR